MDARRFCTSTAVFPGLLNPIVGRELKRLLRTRKAFVGAFVYGFTLLVAVASQWPEQTFMLSGGAGGRIFAVLSGVQLAIFALVAVIACAGGIAGERENRTDELLHTSPLSSWQVVWGKLVAALGYQFILLLASIPALAFCFLLGGVSKWDFILVLVVAVVIQIQAGSLALLVSSFCRRVMTATIISLIVLPIYGVICFAGPGSITVNSFVTRNLPGRPQRAGYYGPRSGAMLGRGGGAPQMLLSLGSSALMLMGAAGAYRWRGRMPVRSAPPVIESPEILRKRRQDFPFYLIDPQKRPPPMPEGRNPLVEKERRVLSIGRPGVLIRSAYIMVGASILFIFPATATAGYQLIFPVLAVVIAVVVPGLACGAIAGERERGTWELLALTGLSAREIVNAKLRVSLRYGAVLNVALGLPCLILVILFRSYTGFGGSRDAVLVLVVTAVLFLELLACAVTGMFFSSVMKRTALATLGCYLFIAAVGIGFVGGGVNVLDAVWSLVGFGGRMGRAPTGEAQEVYDMFTAAGWVGLLAGVSVFGLVFYPLTVGRVGLLRSAR